MKTLAKTDRGRVRKENQDSFSIFCAENAQILIVADGLGGHLGGKRASSLACDTISERIKSEYSADWSDEKVIGFLKQCLNEANSVIWHYSVKEPENRGMGTTVVLCFIRNDKYIILNIGDSRAYIIDDDIRQITVDQSYVQSLVDKGEISKSEARNYPGKSMILQAVGMGDNIMPDVYTGDVSGDILLCSDGLTNELTDEQILKVFKNEYENQQTAVDRLINDANCSGGLDNITAVIAFAERRVK